jgi:hypothetical protein
MVLGDGGGQCGPLAVAGLGWLWAELSLAVWQPVAARAIVAIRASIVFIHKFVLQQHNSINCAVERGIYAASVSLGKETLKRHKCRAPVQGFSANPSGNSLPI